MDQHNIFAQLFHLVHAVAGKDNGTACLALLQQDFFQHGSVYRVQPAERLVQD